MEKNKIKIELKIQITTFYLSLLFFTFINFANLNDHLHKTVMKSRLSTTTLVVKRSSFLHNYPSCFTRLNGVCYLL